MKMFDRLPLSGPIVPQHSINVIVAVVAMVDSRLDYDADAEVILNQIAFFKLLLKHYPSSLKNVSPACPLVPSLHSTQKSRS